MWLLDALTNGHVSRLDPTARQFLPDAEQIAADHGYLVSMERGSAPGRVAVDRLAANLLVKNSYCVLATPASPALWRELRLLRLQALSRQAPVEILEQHVNAGIEAADDDGFDVRMAELASGARGPPTAGTGRASRRGRRGSRVAAGVRPP